MVLYIYIFLTNKVEIVNLKRNDKINLSRKLQDVALWHSSKLSCVTLVRSLFNFDSLDSKTGDRNKPLPHTEAGRERAEYKSFRKTAEMTLGKENYRK